jgi:hypothetical protein
MIKVIRDPRSGKRRKSGNDFQSSLTINLREHDEEVQDVFSCPMLVFAA